MSLLSSQDYTETLVIHAFSVILGSYLAPDITRSTNELEHTPGKETMLTLTDVNENPWEEPMSAETG